MEDFELNTEQKYMRDVFLSLRAGEEFYIYNAEVLEELKEIFDDLEVTKGDFYWIVKSKKAKKIVKAHGGMIDNEK